MPGQGAPRAGAPSDGDPSVVGPAAVGAGPVGPALAADHDIGEPTPPETWLERSCRTLCEIGIVVMAAIVILEIVTRNLFNLSFMISDEIGGYIIVGITFLSLPVCQVNRAYHHVLFVQARLGPRTRAVSYLIFQLLSLGFCAVLIWQLTRLTLQSYQSGDVAPTILATPLWIPQAVMPLGCIALATTLLRAIRMSLRQMMGGRPMGGGPVGGAPGGGAGARGGAMGNRAIGDQRAGDQRVDDRRVGDQRARNS